MNSARIPNRFLPALFGLTVATAVFTAWIPFSRGAATWVLLVLAVAGATASVVVRRRRARGIERGWADEIARVYGLALHRNDVHRLAFPSPGARVTSGIFGYALIGDRRQLVRLRAEGNGTLTLIDADGAELPRTGS